MEFVKLYFLIGISVTFFILLFEYVFKYDRVKAIIESEPTLAYAETFIRIVSTIMMVFIWPYNLCNMAYSIYKFVNK